MINETESVVYGGDGSKIGSGCVVAQRLNGGRWDRTKDSMTETSPQEGRVSYLKAVLSYYHCLTEMTEAGACQVTSQVL